MRDIILDKLKEIEEREKVRILYAAESGSRAWGFSSPDSDYDVRFVFVRPREQYLRLNRPRDVIEWQLDDTLDINGWDLPKALKLLYKSNPTLFEWRASPVVYRTTEEWQRIADAFDGYFLPRAGAYHYLNIAGGNIRKYMQGDEVILKKYFYILRPILACRWILEDGTPPPVELRRLMDRFLDGALREEALRLLELKRNAPEMATDCGFDLLRSYLTDSQEELEGRLTALPGDACPSIEPLNELLLSVLG